MKALLVIDVQNGLTGKKGLYNEAEFIRTVSQAIGKFRESRNPVFFIQHNNKQLIQGQPEWEIDSRAGRQDTDPTVQKAHGNAFEKTGLKQILEGKNIDEVIACGLVSHGCVRATCLGSLELGYKTFLLENGHTNWSPDAEAKISSTVSELLQSGVKLIRLEDL